MIILQKPFSFGLFEQMLPKLPRERFGSPEPYAYYPSHVFELPYSLNHRNNPVHGKQSYTCTEYTVESFDSRSCKFKFLYPYLIYCVSVTKTNRP